MGYSSLHGHSPFSNIHLLDCTSKISSIFDRAHEIGLYGVAITDHEAISSFVEAEEYLAKKKKENPEDQTWQKMKFLRGNEVYLVRDGLTKDTVQRGEKFHHFILLAKNFKGYSQLCELSSRAWRRSFKYYRTRTPTYYSDLKEVIQESPGNLIGSTACLGSAIGERLLKAFRKEESYGEAATYVQNWCSRMKEIFGEGNFYLELQPGTADEQVYVNQQLFSIGETLEIPCIITTDHHYLTESDRKIHKAYLQSRNEEREVDAFYEATYMMDAKTIHERMQETFKGMGYTEEEISNLVEEMLQNTNKVADMCEDYTLLKPLELPYLPQKEFEAPDLKESVLAELVRAIPTLQLFLDDPEPCNRQFVMRLGAFMLSGDTPQDPPRYLVKEKAQQLAKELQIIWDSGQKLTPSIHWSKYLLQVADYINICWNEGDSILAPSRGSAGASYSCHALGINQMDPTREKAPLFFQRFLNPERASVLDIDWDVQSSKRNQCIEAISKQYGEERVIRVSTFKTEKARSAILTAGRALGIPVEETRYIASLCKAPRGIPYTLSEMMYGNPDEDLQPNKEFVKQMKLYPDLWEVAYGIEGLVNGISSHAGGVVITEKPTTHYCGIMKTTGGDFVSSFDLHQLEAMSLIKVDLLATEGLDKIRTCLDLLIDHGYVERENSLKETYEKVIGVYTLNRENPEMWKLVWDNKILNLFQMKEQSGIQGIALTRPKSLEDLATLNSVIRLAPPDRNTERPLEKYARFRENSRAWDAEMDQWGLTEEEKELMHSMFDYSNGIAAQQEDLYQLMTHEKIAGYGFGRADILRKAVAKKSPKDFEEFEEQFWKDVRERGSSEQLCKYVWKMLVTPQAGYSFNLSHTLSYSLVALQEMNLAFYYPIIFWNTANLIVDSGADFLLKDTEEEDTEEKEENDDQLEEEELAKTARVSNYGRLASAIGQMQNEGVSVLPPDINDSKLTFTPNVERDVILFGLRGIVSVGSGVVSQILEHRPFYSLDDFLQKVKANKTQVVSLIKSGAFDFLDSRENIMNEYLEYITDTKSTVNLRNVQMLISHDLLGREVEFEAKVFNFNKYIRKGYDKKGFLKLDENSQPFYEKHFDLDKLDVNEEGESVLPEPYWKKIYDGHMNKVRKYIKENHDYLVERLNEQLVEENRVKYASGSLAKWSMDSVNFYQGEHELEHADLRPWGVVPFSKLPEEPVVKNRFRSKQGNWVEMYELNYIAGTVVDKSPLKSEITLLTTDGIVMVKAYGVMPVYDKQISQKVAEGKSKIVERSMFARGTKVIVHGMRTGAHSFIAKKYARDSDKHHFMRILEVQEDGTCIVQEERAEVE